MMQIYKTGQGRDQHVRSRRNWNVYLENGLMQFRWPFVPTKKYMFLKKPYHQPRHQHLHQHLHPQLHQHHLPQKKEVELLRNQNMTQRTQKARVIVLIVRRRKRFNPGKKSKGTTYQQQMMEFLVEYKRDMMRAEKKRSKMLGQFLEVLSELAKK
jgi:hypothetical protein